MKRRDIIAAGVAGISAATVTSVAAQKADKENPELAKIRALLKKHDAALTAHDLPAVMACLTDNAAVMGTGPGEWYAGKEALEEAYEHFFKVHDKGAQDFDYKTRTGGLSSDMGWLMTSGDVKGKRDGKDVAYPLNVSLTVQKVGGEWKIAAMHFSTLTGGE